LKKQSKKQLTEKAVAELTAYKLRWRKKLRGFKEGSANYRRARKIIAETNYQITLREKRLSEEP